MSIPARRRDNEGLHASLLPSACTVDEVATHNRADPYCAHPFTTHSDAISLGIGGDGDEGPQVEPPVQP